jgi:hypothetical protein
MKTIDKNFNELLSEVQEAFEARPKEIGGLVHKVGSGEKAITEYFKNKGVEIALNNQVVKKIASKEKKVTQENLQELLNNIGCETNDQAKLRPSNMNTVAIYINDIEKYETKKRQVQKRARARGTTLLSNNKTISLTTDGDFEKAAQNFIIQAYNECLESNKKDPNKKMDADTFAIKLFGISIESQESQEITNLKNNAKEVFTALKSQYGNNAIKDNLAKVEKDPGTWEKVKDFINKFLKLDVHFGINTNVDDKAKYKANKMEPKSLLDHAQQTKNTGQLNTL